MKNYTMILNQTDYSHNNYNHKKKVFVMTKTSLCGLLFLSATTIIQCMESNNSTIGYIDKLMIRHITRTRGFSVLEEKIGNHPFLEHHNNQSIPNAFPIANIIERKETSDLSRTVFRITDEHEVIFNSANPLNRKKNMISDCTEWHTVKEDPNAVFLISNFYDKAALETMISTLKNQK